MNLFTVIQAGPLTTYQDLGRYGHMAKGLTEGGPMDARSFAIANQLVDNDIDKTALEITLGGLSLKCLAACSIALAGAFCPITVNNKPQPMWKTLHLKKNDQLNIGFAALGARAYLAVSGGFLAPVWFDSSATVVREEMGKPITKGQVLEGHESYHTTTKSLPYLQQPSMKPHVELRFVKGYQAKHFSEEALAVFTRQPYKLSKQIDRMGFRLEGEKVPTSIRELYSEGIAKGSIQITGEGQPIVMMRDRQTIGGYPKLGAVISADLDKLAQLTQGATVVFNPISADESIQLYRDYWQSIQTTF
ncbi:biotin-dependent carboxyltransferase family protein [Reinekea marina]|uniref:Biotin-dependent carboxyltransferase family protein n=2 Tax=Reinekea marina TaxID=1310421 RepID=A0ABV7WRE2_9GAMM